MANTRIAFCALLLGLAPCGVIKADDAADWVTVTEDDRAITIVTEQLEATIPKNNPVQWMTGIEKHSFIDRATGYHEIGDGLMVIDWLMEAGSDAEYRDEVFAPDGNGVGEYLWYENETDPARIEYARICHGSSHRKRVVEGPQLCHRMGPVEPEIVRGDDFVAVITTYQYQYAAPGHEPGSRWTQIVIFPRDKRYMVMMDRIDTVNDSEEMFLRNDTPGCVRHEQGDTFSEMYLSYLDGPDGEGLHIPSSEFFEPFAPDEKFGYRRDEAEAMPERIIRGYHLRDPETGEDGPWLAGLTLEPSIVYENWCSQRHGGIIVMIQEIHGRPTRAGDTFSSANIVGFFDSIEEMNAVYDEHRGNTSIVVGANTWRLEASE